MSLNAVEGVLVDMSERSGGVGGPPAGVGFPAGDGPRCLRGLVRVALLLLPGSDGGVGGVLAQGSH